MGSMGSKGKSFWFGGSIIGGSSLPALVCKIKVSRQGKHGLGQDQHSLAKGKFWGRSRPRESLKIKVFRQGKV